MSFAYKEEENISINNEEEKTTSSDSKILVDSFVVLSHFKGHAMAGFGGAIKNISIGIGSKEGKCLIHTAGKSKTSPWGGNPLEPDIHDIGILASLDPVAIDKASIDLVFDAEGSESFKQRVNSRNGLHTLDNAEQIGLGNQKYRLVSIDDPND